MELVAAEQVEPGIVLVTLDRPERRNALSGRMLAELHQLFDRIAGEPATRVVVVTGAGESFCAGADMKADAGDEPEPDAVPIAGLGSRAVGTTARTMAAQELMASLFEKVHRLRQPVIAAVNGAAVGGGFAFALACDIRFADTAGRFGAVFIRHGVSACDMGTSYFLPRLVGASRSAELLLTGRVFDAAEAADMGLVLEVVPVGSVVERALETARLIAANGPLAVWMTKETMWQTLDAPSLRHALDMENRTQVLCASTGELADSFAAFRQGRSPEWRPL